MPVEQVPGFWDYLGQGIQKGVEMHRQNEAITREEAHKKTAEAQANAGLIGQLFQSGAVDSSALSGALTQAGVQGAPVIASKAEKRRSTLAGGQPAIDALSDEERADQGFKTRAEVAQEAAAKGTADVASKRNDILQRFATGGKLTDQEAEIGGVSNPDDRELKKLTQLDPYLGGVGERYVAGQMVKAGGRIDPAAAGATAESAYQTYVQERIQNGLGALNPEQVAYTKQYFNRATENALIEQRKRDLEEYAARSGRIHAEAAKSSAGQNQSLQWFGKVNTAMDNIRKAQADITKGNPTVLYALDNPQFVTPINKGAIDRYKQLEATAEAFRGAQGALASGQIPGNLAELLGAADQVTAAGAGAAVGGGGTGAPPAGAGGPPPAGRTGGPPPAATTPAGRGRAGPAGPSGAPPSTDPVVAKFTGILKSRQGTPAQLKQAVAAGKITQAQYDAIIAAAGKP